MKYRSTKVAWRVVALGCLCLSSACTPEGTEESSALGALEQGLKLDPDFVSRTDPDPAEPARDYTLFEADPVRPVAVLERSGLVAVTNTFDDELELLRPSARGASSCGRVKVGMRPVSVAVVAESRREARLWVVNHLSDSISVVRVDTASCSGAISETLYTGDEPRDIVLTHDRGGRPRVFVTTAHRGQHHPLPGARLGSDLVLPPDQKLSRGLADVFVFDPEHTPEPIAVVNLFTDTPRALAVGDGVVYAAGFKTGNRTSVVPAERAETRGTKSLSTLLRKDAGGHFIERGGELVLAPNARGRARIEGGLPAVSGSGRCMPDPRPDHTDRRLQQVCVKTDHRQRVSNVYLQPEGMVHADCQCTSGDGTLQPATALMVKFFDSPRECGEDYTTFPDGTRGCWLDAAPGGVDTPAIDRADQAPPMAWNADVRLSLPDEDVFAIDVDRLRVKRAYSGVGTILFGMAVQPGSGRVFVTNTDAQNLTRFEGHGQSSSTSVIGHLHESHITVIDPERGRVQPVHLNTHIDYGECCAPNPRENAQSFAFPTAGVFSPDGRDFYFTALGSDKVGVVDAATLQSGFDNSRARRERKLGEIPLGRSLDDAAGPVGLTLDQERHRLYVKTHLSNELVVIDTRSRQVLDRVRLFNPEPPSISVGRAVFYDARFTSSHGDSACASCHVFGDFDGLSWDLGDPDNQTVNNPGPFTLPPELAALNDITLDPFAQNPLRAPQTTDFRSNKGPMSTQTLRGLANHGAQHWRGDRTRNFQDAPARQPNYGSLNEDNSFGEFDVAIAGLNGNDQELAPEVFQSFTDFSLQLTLPPNPVRALDDSLSAPQSHARALYFGCASMSDEQYEQRECTGHGGNVVNVDAETPRCACAANPLVNALRGLPSIQTFGGLLQALFSNPALRGAFDAAAADPAELPPAARAELQALVVGFASARDQLLVTSLALGPKGLLSEPAARALAGTSGALIGILELSRTFETPTGNTLLTLLTSSIPPGALPPDSPLLTPEGLRATFESTFALVNLDLRTLADEAARGTGDFHDILLGCDPSQTYSCELRVTDTVQTCHGCHTLNPKGNAEFDVYRPGFFGTSGAYSFELEAQVLKVPHLRNLYTKVGMFGTAQVDFLRPESVLGANLGGFYAPENAFMGPQVRGTSFLHDGSTDTLHRFHGTTAFLGRDPGTINPNDPGNPGGLQAVLPREETRDQCVQRFRRAPARALASLAPEQREALGVCLAGSPVPDLCFLDPHGDACQAVLGAIAEQTGNPEFPGLFVNQLRFGCYQLGSMLEAGSPAGACYPQGLAEREALESFMLVFDSNLKPMVGQQVTLREPRYDAPFVHDLFSAAERGHCDIALRQQNRGLLVTAPRGAAPEQSRIVDAAGHESALSNLRREDGPITFTCYPPGPDLAEARRSAFGITPN
jgi:DNA-binding beta-propeller fold protein YncE